MSRSLLSKIIVDVIQNGDIEALAAECGIKASTMCKYRQDSYSSRRSAAYQAVILAGLQRYGLVSADATVEGVFPEIAPPHKGQGRKRSEASHKLRVEKLSAHWLACIEAGELSLQIVRDLYRDTSTTPVTRQAASLVLTRAPLRPTQAAVLSKLKAIEEAA